MELKLDAVAGYLNEQVWFQQLRTKWEELDLQSRFYLKISGSAAFVLLMAYLIFSSLWGIHKLKQEISEKNDLLMMIEEANGEIRSLHESGSQMPAVEAAGAWTPYFETIAASAGIDKTIMTIAPDKAPADAPASVGKEDLFDLSLKKSTIRQIVKFAYYLENGARPVRVRNLNVNTGADPSGYMDATISVSAFTLAEDKDKDKTKDSKFGRSGK